MWGIEIKLGKVVQLVNTCVEISATACMMNRKQLLYGDILPAGLYAIGIADFYS